MTSTLVIVVKGLNKKANKKKQNQKKKEKAKEKTPKTKNHRGNTTEEKNVQNRYLNFSLQGYITFLEFQ